MVLGEHCVQETFYDVLSVKETASYEEIRARYKSLILNYHPDKLQASEAGDVDQSLGNKFFNIQKAWEILGNAESRWRYDNELRASKEDLLVAEDVGLDDMVVEYSGELLQFLYQCRCGDQFSIESQELKEMGCTLVRDSDEIYIQMSDTSSATVILPCGSCSFRCFSTPEQSCLKKTSILKTKKGGRHRRALTQSSLDHRYKVCDLEYSWASNILKFSPCMCAKSKDSDVISCSCYDIRTADEAYKVGCAALAAGKLDESLQSLNISPSKCLPEKTSAVAKLQSLISLISQQLQRSAK